MKENSYSLIKFLKFLKGFTILWVKWNYSVGLFYLRLFLMIIYSKIFCPTNLCKLPSQSSDNDVKDHSIHKIAIFMVKNLFFLFFPCFKVYFNFLMISLILIFLKIIPEFSILDWNFSDMIKSSTKIIKIKENLVKAWRINLYHWNEI